MEVGGGQSVGGKGRVRLNEGGSWVLVVRIIGMNGSESGSVRSNQAKVTLGKGEEGMEGVCSAVVASVACQCRRDAVKDSAVCRTGEEVMAWQDKTRRLEGASVTCMLECGLRKEPFHYGGERKTGRGIQPICSTSASCKGRSRDQGKDQGARLERVRSHFLQAGDPLEPFFTFHVALFLLPAISKLRTPLINIGDNNTM